MPELVDLQIGQTIQQLRRKCRMRRADLAASISVSVQQLQKYEKGSNRVTASRLVQIANVLGADVTAFFEGTKTLSVDPTNDNFLPKALMTRQGLELMKAFYDIPNAALRAKILDFVKSVSQAPDLLCSDNVVETPDENFVI